MKLSVWTDAQSLGRLRSPQSSSPNLGQKDWNSTFRTEYYSQGQGLLLNARGEMPVERTLTPAGAWSFRPTPDGSACRPAFAEGPTRRSLPIKFLMMQLARLSPPVKAAKPFKSTIFAHLANHEFASRSHAIRVPFQSGPNVAAGGGRGGAHVGRRYSRL